MAKQPRPPFNPTQGMATHEQASSFSATERRLEHAREDWQRHWQERRSQQRYPLGTPYSCKLELDSGHYPPMPVQLLDISLGGACLLISSLVELRQGEMGELHPQPSGLADGDTRQRHRLRVCWQEIRDWITAVGVAFEPPLAAVPVEIQAAIAGSHHGDAGTASAAGAASPQAL